MRAAFCVAIGNFSGIFSGTPAKRAERSKSRNEYSRLSGYDDRALQLGRLEGGAEQDRAPRHRAPVARRQRFDPLGSDVGIRRREVEVEVDGAGLRGHGRRLLRSTGRALRTFPKRSAFGQRAGVGIQQAATPWRQRRARPPSARPTGAPTPRHRRCVHRGWPTARPACRGAAPAPARVVSFQCGGDSPSTHSPRPRPKCATVR